MAFVVKRPDGRAEIRESALTDRGPRARTLASFRVLDEQVLTRAERAATGPFDRTRIVTRCQRIGVPVAAPAVEHAIAAVLRLLGQGNVPRPGLTRFLLDALSPPGATYDELLPWIDSTPGERGEALVDLLRLGDAIPARPR